MTDHNPPKPTLYERPFCVLDKDATVLGSDPFTALLGQGFVANEIAKRFVKAGELEPTPVSTSTGSGQNGNRTSATIAAPLRRKDCDCVWASSGAVVRLVSVLSVCDSA